MDRALHAQQIHFVLHFLGFRARVVAAGTITAYISLIVVYQVMMLKVEDSNLFEMSYRNGFLRLCSFQLLETKTTFCGYDMIVVTDNRLRETYYHSFWGKRPVEFLLLPYPRNPRWLGFLRHIVQ